MKKYCVDLEIAKELKENGFKSKTYFRYQIDTLGEVEIETNEFAVHDHVADIFNAPASEEIIKELPKEIDNNTFQIHFFKSKKLWSVGYFDYYEPWIYLEDKKLSNCLALVWLYLKKEGY